MSYTFRHIGTVRLNIFVCNNLGQGKTRLLHPPVTFSEKLNILSLTPMMSYNNERCQDIDDNVGSKQNKLMCRKRYCSL